MNVLQLTEVKNLNSNMETIGTIVIDGKVTLAIYSISLREGTIYFAASGYVSRKDANKLPQNEACISIYGSDGSLIGHCAQLPNIYDEVRSCAQCNVNMDFPVRIVSMERIRE